MVTRGRRRTSSDTAITTPQLPTATPTAIKRRPSHEIQQPHGSLAFVHRILPHRSSNAIRIAPSLIPQIQTRPIQIYGIVPPAHAKISYPTVISPPATHLQHPAYDVARCGIASHLPQYFLPKCDLEVNTNNNHESGEKRLRKETKMATVIEISATKVHASPTRALSSQPEDATSSKPSDAPSSRTLITPSFTHSTARFLPATSLSTLKSRHSKLGFSTAIKHHSFTTALLPPAHTTVRPAVLVPAIAPSQSAQPIDNNIHSAPFWMLWLCIPVIICLLGFAVTVYYKFSFRPHLKCQEQLQSRRSYLNHGSNTWIHPRNVLGARSERADHMGRQSNGASLASSTIFPAVQRRVAGVLPSRTELRDCRGLEKFPRQEQVHPIQAEATVQPRMAGQRFYVPQGTRALDHTVPRHSIGLGIEHPRRPGDGRTLKIDPGHYHSPAQPDYSVDTMGVLPPFCGRRESPELAGVFGSLDGGGNIQLSEMRGGGTPWLRSNFALDSPAYASGSALASPTPISSPQHRQYPLQPETCAHPELPLGMLNCCYTRSP